jgi:hypothetical protein
MKALISSNEKIYNSNNEIIGSRIAEVCENEFEVHEDLFWVDCGSNIIANQWYYSLNDEFIEFLLPETTITQITVEQIQTQLEFLTSQLAALTKS